MIKTTIALTAFNDQSLSVIAMIDSAQKKTTTKNAEVIGIKVRIKEVTSAKAKSL